MSSKISIIMPAFNAERHIEEAIGSVLQQTHSDLELIIVNDGSTDDTLDRVAPFKDPRLRVINTTNSGQCAASNAGLAIASGDYIKFFDADDLLNPEHLAAQLQTLGGRDDALCSCAWGRFYNDDPLSAVFEREGVWQNMNSLEWIRKALAQRSSMMGGWLWLIPRKIIEQTGGWDERLSLNNDFEFSMRLLLHSKEVLFAGAAKLYYRTAGNSLSVSKSRAAYEAALLSTKLGCSYLLAKENTAVTRRMCANRYQDWIYQIYPDQPEVVKAYEAEVRALGGSDLRIDGGTVLKQLAKWIGWRNAKLIQQLFYKLGYNKG